MLHAILLCDIIEINGRTYRVKRYKGDSTSTVCLTTLVHNPATAERPNTRKVFSGAHFRRNSDATGLSFFYLLGAGYRSRQTICNMFANGAKHIPHKYGALFMTVLVCC